MNKARIVFAALALAGFCCVLQGCAGHRRVSGAVGIHGSSSGGWGHSISVGVHSHGRRW
jgi:hypothetical protein